MLKYLLCFLRHRIKINLFKLDEATQAFNVYQLEEARSVVMEVSEEVSDEEGEQIAVGKKAMVVEMQQGARSRYLNRITRKYVNSMAICSLKVMKNLIKPQHHLIN